MLISDELSSAIKEYSAISSKFSGTSEFAAMLEEKEKEFEALESRLKEVQKEASKDAKMFAVFDFMQLMNQLIYGNIDDAERSKIMEKMDKIAKNI